MNEQRKAILEDAWHLLQLKMIEQHKLKHIRKLDIELIKTYLPEMDEETRARAHQTINHLQRISV